MKYFNRIAAFNHSQIAKFRLEAIEFYKKYGLEATLAAFKISRTSLIIGERNILIPART